MNEFLTIVLLVFGVLQIILFFKIWGMTNNVRRIKNRMDDSHDFKFYMAIGDKEKAYHVAVEELHDRIVGIYNNFENKDFPKESLEIRNKYRKMIEETGHSIPETLFDAQKFLDLYEKKW